MLVSVPSCIYWILQSSYCQIPTVLTMQFSKFWVLSAFVLLLITVSSKADYAADTRHAAVHNAADMITPAASTSAAHRRLLVEIRNPFRRQPNAKAQAPKNQWTWCQNKASGKWERCYG